MAAWRRKAIETFPELERELQDSEFGIYQLFTELLPLAEAALRSNDDETSRRIYGFAAWCFEQTTGELSNAAGVVFYEHQFGVWELRKDVVRWLTREIARDVWPLWELQLTKDQLAEVRRLFDDASESLRPTESMTSTSTGPRLDSGRSPSCSCSAVKIARRSLRVARGRSAGVPARPRQRT